MQHKKDKKFVVLDRTPSTPQRNVAKRKRSTMGMVEIIYDCGNGREHSKDSNVANLSDVNALHERVERFMPVALIGKGDFFNVYLIKRNVAQRFDFNTDVNDALRKDYYVNARRVDGNEGIVGRVDGNEGIVRRVDGNEGIVDDGNSIDGVNDGNGVRRVDDGNGVDDGNNDHNLTNNDHNLNHLTNHNHLTNPNHLTNHNHLTSPVNIMDSSLSALKVSSKALLTTTQTKDYLTEINILKELRNSPHILKLHRAWCINSYLYIETEHCNLGSFLNLIEYVYKLRRSVLSERFVVYFMMEMCAALIELKRRGVMHCDVAPGNVLMCGEVDGETWMVRDVGEYVRWYCDTRGYVIGDLDGDLGGGCIKDGNENRIKDGNEDRDLNGDEGPDLEGNEDRSKNGNEGRDLHGDENHDLNEEGSKRTTDKSGGKNRKSKIKDVHKIYPSLKITFKLADFNISKFAHSPLQQEGTPRYLPQEALKGCYYHSSDLFSLALIWLEIKEGIDLPSNGTSWHDLRNGSFTCDTFDRHDEKVLRNVLGAANDRMDVERVYAYFKGKYERYDG